MAAEWKAKATAAPAGIAEADDREVIDQDLAGIDVSGEGGVYAFPSG